MEVRHLGLVEYQAALDLQKDLVEQRKQGLIPDQLLLLEHPPVITLGARNHRSRSNVLETPEALAQQGVGLYETGRGGDVTYHGPGQLVGYPIIELPNDRRDVHRYVRDLEEVLILAVAESGITATRIPGLTGIWVADRKLAAMACYQSEVRPYPHPRSLEALRNRAKAWGNQCCLDAAEVFMTVRRIVRNDQAPA